MPSIRSLALASVYVSLALAQRNVTVANTDPSIEYEGENIGNAAICRFESNGTFVPSQPGCYNFASSCTESVTMGRGDDSSASLTFKGSAIYINSGLYRLSPLYTVTLDGEAEDVDGFRESGAFTCQPLFSRTGLDPNVEHTITLSIQGPSPQGNSTEIPNTENALIFSLIDFTYTAEDSGNSTLASSEANSPSSAASQRPSASSPGTEASPSGSADGSDEGAAASLVMPTFTVLSSLLALVSTFV